MPEEPHELKLAAMGALTTRIGEETDEMKLATMDALTTQMLAEPDKFKLAAMDALTTRMREEPDEFKLAAMDALATRLVVKLGGALCTGSGCVARSTTPELLEGLKRSPEPRGCATDWYMSASDCTNARAIPFQIDENAMTGRETCIRNASKEAYQFMTPKMNCGNKLRKTQ